MDMPSNMGYIVSTTFLSSLPCTHIAAYSVFGRGVEKKANFTVRSDRPDNKKVGGLGVFALKARARNILRP